MITSDALTAGGSFMIGLAMSAHCLGMCGGFVAAYSLPHPAEGRRSPTGAALQHVQFNLGRLVTFTLFGALAGAAGDLVNLAGRLGPVRSAAGILGGTLMIVSGLVMLGLFRNLRWDGESQVAGSRWYQSGLKRAIQSPSRWKPLWIGLLVGFLPCGALHTMALYAVASASALQGGVILAAYCLGTTPALFGFGVVSQMLGQRMRQRILGVAALLVILMGAHAIWRGLGA